MPPPRDPRLDLGKTASGQAMDRGIRHSTFLERLKTQHTRGTVGFLNTQVFPDVIDRLRSRLDRIKSRGFDRGPWTTKRYKDMIARMGAQLTEGMNGAHALLRADLRDLAITEAEWQAATLRQSAGPFGLEFTMPAKPTLRAIVDGQPMRGLNLKGWFKDLGDSTKQGIAREIGIGMAQGETTGQLIARIRGTATLPGVFPTTRRHAQTIVRTSVTHVSAQAREMTYEDNKEVIKGVLWVSTLDGRTCFRSWVPVRMADGTQRPIADVVPGDWIVTGKGRPGRVVARKVDTGTDWRVLLFEDGTTIECTGNHPFWTARGWTEAQDLEDGQSLGVSTLRRDVHIGSGPRASTQRPPASDLPSPTGWLRLVKIKEKREVAACYDIEVEGDHSFLVSSVGLIAHNSEICVGLDGQTFPVGEGERPPAHPQCRSTTTPILKSWKELGIDLKEAPEGTRASMNGQVPAKITYRDWIQNQPRAIQDQVLGRGKAQLMRSGQVPIDRFFDAKNRPLTLGQIRKLEGLPATMSQAQAAANLDKEVKAWVDSQPALQDVGGKTYKTLVDPAGRPNRARFNRKTGRVETQKVTAHRLHKDLEKDVREALTKWGRSNPSHMRFTTVNVADGPSSFALRGSSEQYANMAGEWHTAGLRSGLDRNYVSLNPKYFAKGAGTFDGVRVDRAKQFRAETFTGGKILQGKTKFRRVRKPANVTDAAWDEPGHWFATSDVQGLINHELGHVVDLGRFDAAQVITRRGPNSAVTNRARAYAKNNPPTRATLSEYGLTNERETFAEAYSASWATPVAQQEPWLKGWTRELVEGYKDANLPVPIQFLQ
jgi:hypothetical protein